MRRLGWGFVLICLLLLAPLAGPAQAADADTLTIRTADGKSHDFTIELARTPEEREIGLMNRPNMAADHGMLFDFDPPEAVTFWMKDTLIPLDMIFIDAKGKVTGVAARAVPQSEELIASPGPARAVLEVNGGTADRLAIAAGAVVIYPWFKN